MGRLGARITSPMPISCGARASLSPPVRPRLVVMKPPRTRIGTIFATLNSVMPCSAAMSAALTCFSPETRAMDQNAERVAGLFGQSHRSVSEEPNYTRSRAANRPISVVAQGLKRPGRLRKPLPCKEPALLLAKFAGPDWSMSAAHAWPDKFEGPAPTPAPRNCLSRHVLFSGARARASYSLSHRRRNTAQPS